MADITYKDLIAPSFYGLWNDIIQHKYPEIWLAGGRGSTKSSFASVVATLLMEQNPKFHTVCFRKYAANLADSIYSQFEFTINEKLRPIAHNWIFKKSPLKIIRQRPNGQHQQILFRGLDDPQKVKSLKMPFGWPAITIFEELAEFDGIEEIRNVTQSLHRGGHWFTTICAYNPPESTVSWVNAEAAIPQIVDGKLHRYVHHSDYRTVPKEWLGENFFVEAELLKKTNERAYRHEYLGETTGNGGAIFPNCEAMEMTDEFIAQFSNRRFGVDWGYAIDPACWLALEYDKTRRTIYIYDEIYGIEMTNQVFGGLILQKDMGFSYLMCDAAEPKSIAEFETMGINALPAIKGPDSVRFSTKWLQGLTHIYIDPIRCPNAFREFSQYEYEKNKSGLFVSKYPDKNNHAIDSCLSGDTLVNTNHGKIPIQKLVGLSGRCLGYDIEEGKTVEVKFCNVRKTKRNAEVVRIKLQDADDIICTPDHRILVEDNGLVYKQAAHLSKGNRIKLEEGIAKIVSIEALENKQDVYDMEIPQTHNLSINNGVIVHNCRYALMEDAIQAGLF